MYQCSDTLAEGGILLLNIWKKNFFFGKQKFFFVERGDICQPPVYTAITWRRESRTTLRGADIVCSPARSQSVSDPALHPQHLSTAAALAGPRAASPSDHRVRLSPHQRDPRPVMRAATAASFNAEVKPRKECRVLPLIYPRHWPRIYPRHWPLSSWSSWVRHGLISISSWEDVT